MPFVMSSRIVFCLQQNCFPPGLRQQAQTYLKVPSGLALQAPLTGGGARRGGARWVFAS